MDSCLESTWYIWLLLTLGAGWCVLAGVVVFLIALAFCAEFALKKLELLKLAIDFALNKKKFEQWKKETSSNV